MQNLVTIQNSFHRSVCLPLFFIEALNTKTSRQTYIYANKMPLFNYLNCTSIRKPTKTGWRQEQLVHTLMQTLMWKCIWVVEIYTFWATECAKIISIYGHHMTFHMTYHMSCYMTCHMPAGASHMSYHMTYHMTYDVKYAHIRA